MAGYLDGAPSEEDVRAAYRTLLGREPESDDALRHHVAHPTRRALHAAILGSDEYRRQGAFPPPPPPRLQALLRAYGGDAGEAAPPGWLLDPLGVRQRRLYREVRGRQLSWGDEQALEWLALLESLEAARDRLTVMELGAGFGPWLARAGVAWRRRRGMPPPRLIGVEAEPTHARWLAQHLADNDLLGPDTLLHEAAVAAAAGEASFEVAEDPARDWATRLADAPAAVGLGVAGAARRRVRAVTLAELLAGEAWVDLLHLDIQGSELAVLRAGAPWLGRVGRLCIGTHGREIEAGLLDLLPAAGFRLEAEQACRYGTASGPPRLAQDGVQYWVGRRP